MFRAVSFHAMRLWHGLSRGPRAALSLLTAPFRWTGAFFVRMANWWSRREGRYLLRGVPALIAFGGAAFLLVACRFQSSSVIAQTYLSAARAHEASQPEVAAMLLERVVTLRREGNETQSQEDNEILFELASMTQRSGDGARTAVLMRELTDEVGDGYWPAHLEMGKAYQKFRPQTHESFEQARKHFETAISLNKEGPDAYAHLGQLYFNNGRFPQAIPRFEEALARGTGPDQVLRPDLEVVLLLLAKAYARVDELARSRDVALRAQAAYEARVARDGEEDVNSRIILADIHMFLEEFPKAADTLDQGLLLNPESRELRTARAQLNVAWSRMLKRTAADDPETSESRLGLLSDALKLDPNYALIFEEMMELLQDQGQTATAARDFLLTRLTEGDEIGLCHLLLGSAAFKADDPQGAAYHLERAYQLMDGGLIVANNLAWFLAQKPEPELDRALEMINNVLRRVPNDPRFLDTRGLIYTKLERWDEAIADLERALQVTSPGPETHQALAICYEQKGLRELASRHRQLGEPTTGP